MFLFIDFWSLEDAMQTCVNDVRGRGRLFESTQKVQDVRRDCKQKTVLSHKKCSKLLDVQRNVDRCSSGKCSKMGTFAAFRMYLPSIRKIRIAIRGKKIFSGYFLLNVVNCKSKKCSEMKIVRRDDDVPDSI